MMMIMIVCANVVCADDGLYGYVAVAFIPAGAVGPLVQAILLRLVFCH